jgi:hypothetical protein
MTEDLAVRLATIFVFDASGRVVRNTDPDRGAAPRLYIGGCASGNVACVRHDVGTPTAHAIEQLVAEEPPLDAPERVPVHLDRYVELLAVEAPVDGHTMSVNYRFPRDFEYAQDASIVVSDTDEEARAECGMTPDRVLPEPLTAIGFSTVGKLWTPWCVALFDGEVASMAETVRIGAAGAEVGVNTVPDRRGRGFAAAATAGWATSPSLRGRTLFYSTSVTNRSSQRVTERLGLDFIGASLSVT